MAYYRNIYEDQNVYIAGYKLRGVQAFDGGYEIPYEPIKVAGVGYLDYSINSNLEGNFNVKRFVVSTGDPLTGMFITPLSGHLSYKGVVPGSSTREALRLSFNNGYINSYSSACAIGEVATLDFGIVVYGHMGSEIPAVDEGTNDDTILIPRMGDIMILNVSGEKSNLVTSYDYRITIPRKPIYTLGSGLEPGLFNIDYPIEVDLTFSMTVDDFEADDMHDLLCDQPKGDICIILSGCGGNGKIREFHAPCPIFMGIDEKSSIRDPLTVDLKYKSYIDNITGVPPLVAGGQCGYAAQECVGAEYL